VSSPFPPLVPLFQWKQGASFVAACQYQDAAGVNQSLPVGMTVTSQVRRLDGTLVSTLAYTAGAAGAFELRDNSTLDWPLGFLVWDIKYTLSSVIADTETMMFEMVRKVTA
jgi:hypothetical protein